MVKQVYAKLVFFLDSARQDFMNNRISNINAAKLSQNTIDSFLLLGDLINNSMFIYKSVFYKEEVFKYSKSYKNLALDF